MESATCMAKRGIDSSDDPPDVRWPAKRGQPATNLETRRTTTSLCDDQRRTAARSEQGVAVRAFAFALANV